MTYEIGAQYKDAAKYFGINRKTGSLTITQPLTNDQDLSDTYKVREPLTNDQDLPNEYIRYGSTITK